MEVQEIQDTHVLRAFLAQDPVGNAYLLGDLADDYLPFCRWYGARDEDGSLRALVLLYKGLRLPALLTVTDGDPASAHLLADIFSYARARSLFPSPAWIHAWRHHLPPLETSLLHAQPLELMRRMSLRRAQYQPRARRHKVRPLGHQDTAAIVRLYKHYPDNFFEPYQLESGLYFGIDAPDDGLAAIAGIHVLSQADDIAAIGNLVTRPDLRQQGHASDITSRLLDALFERVSLVTLNVRDNNAAAIALYEKFGFVPHHTYYEGQVDVVLDPAQR